MHKTHSEKIDIEIRSIIKNIYFSMHCGLFSLQLHNARLRGWQRTTTKLKHNSRNHFGSMGLETPRVDSPS
ncbi:hypothetical protein FXE34_10975 [Vibrio cholerae]|nr:hypothetical protein FXE34_10975 [Vibrio cholerae]